MNFNWGYLNLDEIDMTNIFTVFKFYAFEFESFQKLTLNVNGNNLSASLKLKQPKTKPHGCGNIAKSIYITIIFFLQLN